MKGFDDDALDELERDIRQLQIEWDKYFGGIEKRTPVVLQQKVERALRLWLRTEVRNSTLRFRSQSLTARFNVLNQLWNKRVRALEEGRPLGVHRGPPLPIPDRSTSDEPATTRRDPSRPVRVADVGQDREAVRQLYDQFVEARKVAGEGAAVAYDQFEKLIAKQAERILSQKQAQAVDFRLETSGGKVSLKARPVR